MLSGLLWRDTTEKCLVANQCGLQFFEVQRRQEVPNVVHGSFNKSTFVVNLSCVECVVDNAVCTNIQLQVYSRPHAPHGTAADSPRPLQEQKKNSL